MLISVLFYAVFVIIQAIAHPFFHELRQPTTTMPDKTPLAPEMFKFTQEELSLASPEVLELLMQTGSMYSATTESTAPVVADKVPAAAPVANVVATPVVQPQPSSSDPQPAAAVPSVATEDATVA